MNKKILTLGIAAFILCGIPTMSANAAAVPDTQAVSAEVQPKAKGLISTYRISVSHSGKTLYINGTTLSDSSMKSIGYKNVSVEYSSDGVKWYTEKSIGDLLKSDSLSYYLNNYTVLVQGGYYYRVSCTHYAKEKGLFGSSQSVDNTSNSVWID